MDSWAYTAQHYSRALRATGSQMNQLNVASGLNMGQNGPQLNDHLGLGVTANAATNQAMTGHYGSTAAHPHWLFPSHHGLNAASHQTPSHDSSSFNANPFLPHPSYDSTPFLSAPFQSKASYLPSAAVGNGFFNPMKKAENEMNNLRNAYCSPMPGMSSMSTPNNMTADTNNLATGSLFSSHPLNPTSWRHHANLMSSNTSSGPFGILPHEAVNVMNSGSNAIGSGHSHSSHASHSSHGSHGSHSHNSHHSSSSHSKSSSETKGHHYHPHHKSTAMSSMSSAVDNFRNIMPSLPPTQSGHAIASRNQSLEASVGPKITGHQHHSQADPYGANMFAMAAINPHAINTDYTSMQTQRYAPGLATGAQQTMNAFASNTASRSGYPSVGFHTDANARSRELLSSSSLLHGSKQGSSNSCNSRNMSAMNAMNGTYMSNCAMMPMMNSAQSISNYTSSPAHSVNNVISTNHQPASRSSSSASNHGLQQGNDSSCSFGYNSPATNLPQSPYPAPQRSNTANSSQGTPTASGAAVQSSSQDFPSYGASQGFPALGTQTPTPTPGYPTPPSSVGQPHVMSSNSQSSTSHEEQVAHYPQLTPQTASQSAPFNSSYSANFSASNKMPSSNSQTSESLLTNRSSCMVADAANINSAQTNSSVVPQRSSFLLPGAAIHEPEPESCGLSSIVGVNPLSDNLSNSKLASEPSLNFSHELDFPIINFNDDPNFNPSSKVESNTFKKKNKSSKRSKKKDKNKNNNSNNVGVGLGVDPNNHYSAYEYPNQQYQNYQNSNPYLINPMPQSHNQTLQETHPTHNVMSNDTSGADTHTNPCYEMQYQQHLAQPPPSQPQQPPPPPPLPSQSEHELMQPIAPDPLPPVPNVSTVSAQEQQLIEPVMSMASQPLTQTPTNTVPEKQSFPTIDDELSFLTEPTDCVSMETQTPNLSSTVQMETQSPLVINQSSNICSERTTANTSPVAVQNQNSNSNQGNSNSSQPSGFLKSFMSFINSPNSNTQVVTKEKKKKRQKEPNENKVKQNTTLNGQKSKNSKKVKLENSFEFSDDVFDAKKNNFSAINQNTHNMMNDNITTKKSTTGDRENYESKFFKRRPSTNINTNNVHIIEMDSRKDVKNNKKRKQSKMDFHLFGTESRTAHDEYEFPDSPPNAHSVKKSRKSISSDGSNKKRSAPDFEKITSPSINANLKKSSNKKSSPNNCKPVLTTSSTESIENSINSVVMNTILSESEEKEPTNQVELPLQTESSQTTCVIPNNNQVCKKSNVSPNQVNKKSPNLKTSPPTATTTAITLLSTVAIEHIISPNQTSPVCTTNSTTTGPTVCSTATTTTATPSAMTTTLTNSNQSVGMQSAGTNTPRRRSQDKKASTIREGLMRTGDFVVSIDESQYELPVIWRIEGKSLLQRFEPTEQEDITVYINTSSVGRVLVSPSDSILTSSFLIVLSVESDCKAALCGRRCQDNGLQSDPSCCREVGFNAI